MATQVNGIDVDVLKQTVSAMKQDRELGQARFRAHNKWIAANRNVGVVKDFYAAKQEMEHAQAFETHADEPPILAGDDSGANPVEHLLTALAACLTTAMVAHAAVRGVHIEELESEVEGDIDLNGYMGLSTDVPRGYQQIRVSFRVKSDADSEELERLARFSPVFNSLLDGTQVQLQVERAPLSQVQERTEGGEATGMH